MQQQTPPARPTGPNSPTTVTADDARKIIVDGDAEVLVKKAQEVARLIKGSNATATQLRRLFGEVRRIEMKWSEERPEANRRFTLLKPRLAYQVARESSLRSLQANLLHLMDAVEADRERFQRFAEFLEAVVAYSKAEGAR